ncbi:Single-Pass Membrane And Coiled-Coil Domain-Containing Protein 4 [Manis pentadactyla]|nr:Single-Pass Membrane And Coiled-Coil Domain-Containing Protein 4 [Manis pentadactyla]
MRQLKGKPKKETSKDKKERKQAMQEARQQITTVVLPTLAVVVLLIVVFVRWPCSLWRCREALSVGRCLWAVSLSPPNLP